MPPKIHFNYNCHSKTVRCGYRKGDVNFTNMLNLVTCKTCLKRAAKNVV